MPANKPIDSNTRIKYCVSYVPRQAISGGSVLDQAESEVEEIVISIPEHENKPVKISRADDLIVVNNKSIEIGDQYERIYWLLPRNPWIVLTSQIVIANDGIQNDTVDAIYVSGYVEELWILNPLAFLILIYGVWLIWSGTRTLK